MYDLILGGRFESHQCREVLQTADVPGTQSAGVCRTDRQEQLSDHGNNYHRQNTVQSGRPHCLRHGGALDCLSFLRHSENWENSLPSFATLVRLAADEA